MSTRASGFDRVPADLYQTPSWVIDALGEHVALDGLSVWEPACGEGKMARAMEARGAHVTATDIQEYGWAGQIETFDFVGPPLTTYHFHFDSIITNPPYGVQGKLAEKFIETGLKLLSPGEMLALLLPVDFDSGKTRAKYFQQCPDWAAKIVLTRRICWFDPKPGQAGPSANHAWFVWERSHVRRGPALTLYAPSKRVEKIDMEAA